MARLLLKDKKEYSKYEYTEMRVYEVPASRFFPDKVKYSMSYIRHGKCVLRYDNEASKGHHMHIGEIEEKIKFRGIDELLDEFELRVKKIREGKT